MGKCPHLDLTNGSAYKNGVPFNDLNALRKASPVSKQQDTVWDEP